MSEKGREYAIELIYLLKKVLDSDDEIIPEKTVNRGINMVFKKIKKIRSEAYEAGRSDALREAAEQFWSELKDEAEKEYDNRLELLGPIETNDDAAFRKTLNDGWSAWLMAKHIITNRRAAIFSADKESADEVQKKADERAYKWRHEMTGDGDPERTCETCGDFSAQRNCDICDQRSHWVLKEPSDAMDKQIVDDWGYLLELVGSGKTDFELAGGDAPAAQAELDLSTEEISFIRFVERDRDSIRKEERKRAADLHCCFCPQAPGDGSECNCHQRAHFFGSDVILGHGDTEPRDIIRSVNKE